MLTKRQEDIYFKHKDLYEDTLQYLKKNMI